MNKFILIMIILAVLTVIFTVTFVMDIAKKNDALVCSAFHYVGTYQEVKEILENKKTQNNYASSRVLYDGDRSDSYGYEFCYYMNLKR